MGIGCFFLHTTGNCNKLHIRNNLGLVKLIDMSYSL